MTSAGTAPITASGGNRRGAHSRPAQRRPPSGGRFCCGRLAEDNWCRSAHRALGSQVMLPDSYHELRVAMQKYPGIPMYAAGVASLIVIGSWLGGVVGLSQQTAGRSEEHTSELQSLTNL